MYQGKELEKILPHKYPMILIDRVVSCELEKKKLITEVNVSPQKLFFDEVINGIPIWVGVEYMGQSIGALSGIYCQQYKKKQIDLGFVIGTRNYECFAPHFKNGQSLKIHIEQLFFDSELGAFDCTITDGTQILVKAHLNVFQPASSKDFLKNIK